MKGNETFRGIRTTSEAQSHACGSLEMRASEYARAEGSEARIYNDVRAYDEA